MGSIIISFKSWEHFLLASQGAYFIIIIIIIIHITLHIIIIITILINTLLTLCNFISRAGITGSFSLIYLYAVEVYPTAIRTTAIGTASSISRFAG
jgi:hypothetical protein